MTVQLSDIKAAAAQIVGAVLRTPLIQAPELSALTGATVYLKLETLQRTGSFKSRGALVRLLALSPEQRRIGIVAMSAGNHAQGVADHARRLGIPATIVMPHITPFTKVERTRAMNARVRLEGETLSEAQAFAEHLAEHEGLTLIHPYDDPLIIAGQGTVALEMLEDQPDLDILVVPIGGGGLIAGMAVAAKAIRPTIEVIGVQAELYPSMQQALRGQVPRVSGSTLAEGIAVKTPGRLTLPIIREHVADILLAGESALEKAVQMLMEIQKIVAEGAGAAALAGLLSHRPRFVGKRVGLVVSGGNIDSRLISSILMRGLMRGGRIARLRIELTDTPGALAKVAALIGESGGNIIEVAHQRLFSDVPVKFAEIDVMVETTGNAHVAELIEHLRHAGFSTRALGSLAEGD